MNMETIFQLSNLLVMPFWLLMIFLPKWSWTRRIIGSIWVVAPIALLYAFFVVPNVPSFIVDLANPSLDRSSELLGTAEGAAIGWIHFLAFDLFVGRWAYLDSQERGISPWLASVALFFTLMFGPLGLIIYLVVRWIGSRR